MEYALTRKSVFELIDSWEHCMFSQMSRRGESFLKTVDISRDRKNNNYYQNGRLQQGDMPFLLVVPVTIQFNKWKTKKKNKQNMRSFKILFATNTINVLFDNQIFMISQLLMIFFKGIHGSSKIYLLTFLYSDNHLFATC